MVWASRSIRAATPWVSRSGAEVLGELPRIDTERDSGRDRFNFSAIPGVIDPGELGDARTILDGPRSRETIRAGGSTTEKHKTMTTRQRKWFLFVLFLTEMFWAARASPWTTSMLVRV